MIASAHVAAGAVAGMAGAYATEHRIRRIAIAFSLGIVSHIALDAIPHSDYASLLPSIIPWVVLCEIVGIGAIAGYILRQRLLPNWPGPIVAGLVGSMIPDAKFYARVFLPRNVALVVGYYGDYFHSFFHHGPMSFPPPGFATQIICTLLLLGVLTRLPHTHSESVSVEQDAHRQRRVRD